MAQTRKWRRSVHGSKPASSVHGSTGHDSGCRKRAGSSASATTTYGSNTAIDAIDGDFGTYWNSGGFTGSLTVSFASAATLGGVRLFVSALPTTSETYTIFGYQNGNPTQIGQSTQTAQQGGGALSTIAVTPGSYDAIRVDVNGNQSWVAINEMSLTTTYCP